ncbi:MAG TPA: 16S rRNA (guanine(527)-N(7))-methyltransferase RsmG [Vicinamibacterales bacterium]|nr:16S rRNA (guanine(527)-N(7))-methyltransferase RsmG [Vicinamibacterales bacterium]
MSDPHFEKKLAERAAVARVALTTSEMSQLEAYFALLKRWSARMNLTALPLDGLPNHTVDRLFIEPLAAARYVQKSPLDWIDIGSGGGSPAIPLKVLRKHARLTMVESKGRKAAFLREAVRTLELHGTDVQSVRFEELQRVGAADLITIRAVRADAELLARCRGALRADGEILLFQSAPLVADVPGFKHLRAVQLTDAPAFLDVLRAV